MSIKEQNKSVKRIGKDVFKIIVAMAWEMGVREYISNMTFQFNDHKLVSSLLWNVLKEKEKKTLRTTIYILPNKTRSIIVYKGDSLLKKLPVDMDIEIHKLFMNENSNTCQSLQLRVESKILEYKSCTFNIASDYSVKHIFQQSFPETLENIVKELQGFVKYLFKNYYRHIIKHIVGRF